MQTPKVPKSVKKATLWSEVVMKNLGKTPKKEEEEEDLTVASMTTTPIAD